MAVRTITRHICEKYKSELLHANEEVVPISYKYEFHYLVKHRLKNKGNPDTPISEGCEPYIEKDNLERARLQKEITQAPEKALIYQERLDHLNECASWFTIDNGMYSACIARKYKPKEEGKRETYKERYKRYADSTPLSYNAELNGPLLTGIVEPITTYFKMRYPEKGKENNHWESTQTSQWRENPNMVGIAIAVGMRCIDYIIDVAMADERLDNSKPLYLLGFGNPLVKLLCTCYVRNTMQFVVLHDILKNMDIFEDLGVWLFRRVQLIKNGDDSTRWITSDIQIDGILNMLRETMPDEVEDFDEERHERHNIDLDDEGEEDEEEEDDPRTIVMVKTIHV